MGSSVRASEMATMQILISFSLMVVMVSALPQLPAFPNPAHTSLLAPSLAAHPNAAHTSQLSPSLAAHPNPAHTSPLAPSHPTPAHSRLSPDCARFSGAFPCAPGDSACLTD